MEDVPTPPESALRGEGMPEAGNDPSDPLRPEIEEEHSPDPPLAEPHQDVDATEPADDIADLDSNGSDLSDLDDAEFEEFDAANIAIDDTRAVAVDESNVRLLGVHKRKRGDGEERPRKKREGRREKKKRARRDEDENFSGGEQLDGKRARKRKEAGGERRKKERSPVNEDDLTPEERMCMHRYARLPTFLTAEQGDEGHYKRQWTMLSKAQISDADDKTAL
jgi:transcription factor SPN1